MKINYNERTIEMTNAEAKLASKFGSEKFKELMEIKTTFSNYEIKVIKRKQAKRTKSVSFKGFTYDFMKAYIEAHDDNKTIIKEFEIQRGNYGIESNTSPKAQYIKIRNWFISEYKDVFTEQYEAIQTA
jgi:galactokinase